MLILTRKPGESIYIGDVKVTLVEMKGNQARIGIDADPSIRIFREEIYDQIKKENKRAAEAAQGSGGAEDLQGLSEAWSGRKKLGSGTESRGQFNMLKGGPEIVKKKGPKSES